MSTKHKKQLELAHQFCFANRPSILKSNICGCFSCGAIFSATLISEWTEELNDREDTAWCPHCYIDSIIGDFDHEITKSFLREMNFEYFGPGDVVASLG